MGQSVTAFNYCVERVIRGAEDEEEVLISLGSFQRRAEAADDERRRDATVDGVCCVKKF